MNLPEDIKAFVTFIKLMFYIVLLLNIQACVWYFVVKKNEFTVTDGVSMQWYPPSSWINYVDSEFF